MDKLNAQLASAEEKLGDSELYDASRKAELTECLQQQASAKSGLEECEMAAGGPGAAGAHASGRLNSSSSSCLRVRCRWQGGFLPSSWPAISDINDLFCCKLASLAARPHIG